MDPSPANSNGQGWEDEPRDIRFFFPQQKSENFSQKNQTHVFFFKWQIFRL